MIYFEKNWKGLKRELRWKPLKRSFPRLFAVLFSLVLTLPLNSEPILSAEDHKSLKTNHIEETSRLMIIANLDEDRVLEGRLALELGGRIQQA